MQQPAPTSIRSATAFRNFLQDAFSIFRFLDLGIPTDRDMSSRALFEYIVVARDLRIILKRNPAADQLQNIYPRRRWSEMPP